MNFLAHQVANGLQPGPHFRHCYIYEGHHCSCGGNYQGPDAGPEIRGAGDIGKHLNTKETP